MVRMEKKRYRIGDFSKDIGVKNFVIRFWEKEFGIKSSRTVGGQRYYNQIALDKFKLIKKLLYEQKFTVEGAKKELSKFSRSRYVIPAEKTSIDPETIVNKELKEQLIQLRTNLIKLKNLL